MTMDALAAYGVEVHENNGAFRIPGRQRYSAGTVPEPELDWSGAAFWLAMNALGSKISVPGLNPLSRQPDMAIRDMAGGWQNPVDVSQCPDLFPVLAVLAAARDGRSVFTGVRRLRLKESDRILCHGGHAEKAGRGRLHGRECVRGGGARPSPQGRS